MRPAHVLDLHADLLSRTEDYRFKAVLASLYSLDFGKAVQHGREREETVENSRVLADTTHNHVRAAYTYQVTEDMVAMVKHAAHGLDSTDKMHMGLAPTACGLVRFDSPLLFQDVRGKQMKAHWLLWGPVSVTSSALSLTGRIEPGTYMCASFWHDPTDPDEVIADWTQEEEMRAVMGRWRWVGADLLADGHDVGDETFMPSEAQMRLIESEGDAVLPGTNGRRYIHALWMLLGQSITTMSQEPVDRHTTKRIKRLDLRPSVTVVQLRRSEGGYRQEGESQVEWQYRWLVRNHWRWQPYGPLTADHPHVWNPPEVVAGVLVRYCAVEGCENRIERIMINAYCKGPDGAPLKMSEKVYRLER